MTGSRCVASRRVNHHYRRLFCRQSCPLPPAEQDLLQAKTGDILLLPFNGGAHAAVQPVSLCKPPPCCLDSPKQVAVGFRFDGGTESILKPAQSSDDRLHTRTLTGKLSTNRSRASSLSRSRPGRQRSKRTTSIRVPFAQSVLWHSAFSKLGSRSMHLTTVRSTFRGLPLAALVRSSSRAMRRFSVACIASAVHPWRHLPLAPDLLRAPRCLRSRSS